MDLFDVLLQTGLFTAAVVVYLIFIRKTPKIKGFYQAPGWNFPLKLFLARYAVKRWKTKLPKSQPCDTPRLGQLEGWDAINLRTSAPDGATLVLGIRKVCTRKPIAEVTLYVKLADGTTYKLQQHPETAVSEWKNTEGGWSAGGLKIQVLDAQNNLRIIFNGLLVRVEDNKTQHVKLNFIWSSATSLIRHPEDWSEQLAAETLALEPWRNGQWPKMLNKCGEGSGSWMQWGAVQGRFQSFDESGAPDKSEYIRARGVRERSWVPTYKNIRRTFTITVAARDGTAVQIRGQSYYKNFTQCISGCVRFPNFMVKGISSTDMVMSNFCETASEIPNTFTINLSTTNNRTIKVILRINKDGGRVLTGVPHQQEIYYRTLRAEIDGEHGTGILELEYDKTEKSQPSISPTPLPALVWLREQDAGEVKYCVSFEDRAAACTDIVGGKGASLALLASVQKTEGYHVPPGFCITTKALNQHLQVNSAIEKSINEIENANEDYDEVLFKEKCSKTVEMFLATEIVEAVKKEILEHVAKLRQRVAEQDLGSQLRFAVRSSAVGEDSEALSAAGQNDTVLGCASDDDVLRGVRACWASMFAFTSAYYRRQNGQPCLCGGGVVVQAMVEARSAGVMFTAHPAHGDPSRLLITANYGLGESVVSGSAEPDTVIIKRGIDDKLTIAKIDIGSKIHRVTTSGDGVSVENVSDTDRTKPCLSESEILRLAEIGVSQEKLWGAPRDIEWAVYKDEIYLLQARPITSLERWTEEELLHELDLPVMSDDELITFANTGEVIPNPLTPLSHDLVFSALEKGISSLMMVNGDGYDRNIAITHNRCAIALYNSVYRMVPKEIDVNIRMLEMSIHGHKVADDSIISTALHRRQPRPTDKIFSLINMIKTLIVAKWTMNDIIKRVNIMNLTIESDDPLTMLSNITAAESEMVKNMTCHSTTSTASTFTQFIAMTILLEGRSEFTPEECNEISALLSSGDVLSAEVPQALARLARKLEESGKIEQFKSQDPRAAMDWLKYNLPDVYNDVCLFLDQHGHRAIMEFDLLTKPWVLAPEEFMKMLMQVRPTKAEDKKSKSIDEIIASLKTPKKTSTRKVLRWVLPLCRRTVRYRESTKAHLILAVHKARLAVRSLAKVLVRRWYLPHPDLIFFFRLHELTEYIKTRDPAMLKKAAQRQQYYAGWCKLKFAEVNKGWVEPLKNEGPRITSGEVKLEATSVCGGEVVARACVVKDLSEIDQLQQGDVLITHATDIGWSPYFPLLSGIVTELGGLISHGAVIAREYGLPCIVGATHATDMFTTGDTVRLSGTHGLVEKVTLVPQTTRDESEANQRQ